MKICFSKHRLSAFTLIEVMISSALMALILVSAYMCLGAGFSAQKLIEPRAEIIQNARVALALMTADLRAACLLSKSDDFLGMTRVVGLKLEYFDGDDWYDSWGEVKTSDKKQSSAREKNNLAGLPDAVRITLLMDSNPKKKNPDMASIEEKPEPPLVFQTVTRLNLAAAQNNSSDAGNVDNSSSPGQMPGNGGSN